MLFQNGNATPSQFYGFTAYSFLESRQTTAKSILIKLAMPTMFALMSLLFSNCNKYPHCIVFTVSSYVQVRQIAVK